MKRRVCRAQVLGADVGVGAHRARQREGAGCLIGSRKKHSELLAKRYSEVAASSATAY